MIRSLESNFRNHADGRRATDPAREPRRTTNPAHEARRATDPARGARRTADPDLDARQATDPVRRPGRAAIARAALVCALLASLATTGHAALRAPAASTIEDAPAPASTATQAPARLQRVALIGASVTDGFLLPHEVGAMVTLADSVRAAVKADVPLPYRRSSALFFSAPLTHGECYVDQALARDPSLVIAIDFLFWYAYGFLSPEEARLERLERGLEQLARFSCPIVIGDLPDFRVAATDGVGIHHAPMIYPRQVPEPKTLEAMNRRLREWAEARGDVHIVPVVDFRRRVEAGEGLTLRGNTWGKDARRRLMDKDLLHTSFEGTCALTVLIMDTIAREREDVDEEALVWDVEEVKARVLEARAVEIAQRRG